MGFELDWKSFWVSLVVFSVRVSQHVHAGGVQDQGEQRQGESGWREHLIPINSSSGHDLETQHVFSDFSDLDVEDMMACK